MSQKKVRNTPAIPVYPAPVVDDWPYVLHANTVASLPSSIRSDFQDPDEVVLAQRIVVGGPGHFVVLDEKGMTTVHQHRL